MYDRYIYKHIIMKNLKFDSLAWGLSVPTIHKGSLFGKKKVLQTLGVPCLERCLWIRAALTQHLFAHVFDASFDALPVILVLKSQLQHAEAYVSVPVAERRWLLPFVHVHRSAKMGLTEMCPLKNKWKPKGGPLWSGKSTLSSRGYLH